ncbi:PhzF family phenazine biosynthesis protein [Priestia abyssalis]|uniref:PhzF family phenazine biosynthesis protein n=1 Tax=Priestia abyssalis TaxID=1221450 RepID=UPI0009958572|nr:PhzF family phenazine biosynthesis protein [Priestia abyssalis]
MDIQVYTLNAFTKGNEGGNLAGVVLDADGLGMDHMQRIAKEVGFSETAFIQPSKKADFLVRFFTPTDEVPICGHATLAAFHVMLSENMIEPGMYTQETKAGILEVEVKEDGSVFLAQNLPKFEAELNREQIACSLNIDIVDLNPDMPVQIVSTGLPDVMVPVRSLDVLEAINPNFDQISDISKQYEAVGYHVFYAGTDIDPIAYCRNFAPLYGILEESATGSSTGALSCYLYRYGKVKAHQAQELQFEQGHTMGAASELKAYLLVNEHREITKISVGGSCSVIESRIVYL